MRRHLAPARRLLIVGFAVCFLGALATPAAQAPAKSSKAKPLNPADIKRLDVKMEEVRDSFLRETTTLIKSYEELGQLGRARMLLEALQKLDPRNEPVKQKLEQLNGQILDAGQFTFEIDAGQSWQVVGTVAKDQPIRIKVTGEYKLATSFTSGPDGLPADNPADDLVTTIALGAVMAVIAPPGAVNRGNGNKSADKPPKPFTVGSSYEKSADRDGVLCLKVNVPPSSKCTGQLTAKISGVVQAP